MTLVSLFGFLSSVFKFLLLILFSIFSDQGVENEIFYIAEFIGSDMITEEKVMKKKASKALKSKQTARKEIKPFIMPQVGAITSKLTYTTGRGNNVLIYEGHRYIKNNSHSGKTYWKCTKWHSGCKARAITNVLAPDACMTKNTHNHDFKLESEPLL